MPESNTPVTETAEVEQKEPVQVQAAETTTPEDGKEPEVKDEEKKEEIPEKKEPEEKKENHFERRQRRLLQERAEFKARAELLEQMMTQQKPAVSEGLPQRDKFESDEEYVRALNAYTVNESLKGIEERLLQKLSKSSVEQSWGQKISQARSDYPDYDEVMELAQDIPITKHVAEAMQGSDFGADVAYYLAKNPEEAERINTLPAMAAAREIGRIESYVEYEKGQKKAKPVMSKAPAPIKPVKPSTSAGNKSLEDMTPAEYIAYRNKQAKR